MSVYSESSFASPPSSYQVTCADATEPASCVQSRNLRALIPPELTHVRTAEIVPIREESGDMKRTGKVGPAPEAAAAEDEELVELEAAASGRGSTGRSPTNLRLEPIPEGETITFAFAFCAFSCLRSRFNLQCKKRKARKCRKF